MAVYGKDNEEVIKFYSRAQTLDQRFIDTRQAQMLSWEHFSVDTALGRGEGIRLFYQAKFLNFEMGESCCIMMAMWFPRFFT